MDVDKPSVVSAVNRGRAKNRETHAFPVQLFEQQSGVGLEDVVEVDPDGGEQGHGCHLAAVTKRHHPHGAGIGSSCLGLFSPFYGRPGGMHGVGAAIPIHGKTDALARDVSIVPGTIAFRYCFPPPIMAGHIVQYLAECKARAVVILPDAKAYWFPSVRLATVRSTEMAQVATEGCFQWRSSNGGLKNQRYHWGMIA